MSPVDWNPIDGFHFPEDKTMYFVIFNNRIQLSTPSLALAMHVVAEHPGATVVDANTFAVIHEVPNG